MNTKPTRKVGGGVAIGAPVGMVLVWVLNSYVVAANPIPGEVAAAIGSICSFLASYFIRDA